MRSIPHNTRIIGVTLDNMDAVMDALEELGYQIAMGRDNARENGMVVPLIANKNDTVHYQYSNDRFREVTDQVRWCRSRHYPRMTVSQLIKYAQESREL